MYLKNWRPISLLNVDTKIATKVLALRLESVLPSIIHFNQNAYVKGRTIFDAAHTIEDVIEYAKRSCTPGLLVAIDFEKAFDSLKWSFLFETLEIFNFGKNFIKWVKLFYTNITSCALNGGFSTNYFKINQTRGSPLSLLVYNLSKSASNID